MSHRLVKVVLGEGLCVVCREGGNKSDDHLANQVISVGLEMKNLLCSV